MFCQRFTFYLPNFPHFCVFPVTILKFIHIFLFYKGKRPSCDESGESGTQEKCIVLWKRPRAVVWVLVGRTGQVQARDADFSSVQRNRLSIGAAQPDPTDRAGFPFFPLLDRHADAEQEISQVTRWSLAVGSCRNLTAFPIFLPRSSSPPFRSPGAFAVRPHGGRVRRWSPERGPGLPGNSDVTTPPPRIGCRSLWGRRRGGRIRGRRPERAPALPGNSDVTAPPPRSGCRSLWGRRRGGGMAGESRAGSCAGCPRSPRRGPAWTRAPTGQHPPTQGPLVSTGLTARRWEKALLYVWNWALSFCRSRLPDN